MAAPQPRPGSTARSRPAAVLAALGLLALPLLAGAACRVESLDMPIKMVGSRAVATVGINGASVPLTVDSGAFYSFLTEAAAAQLKLSLRSAHGLRVAGITGRVETYLTTVDKLHLLKGEIARVEFVVGGNEPGAGTMGLMGRNMLSFTDTEYDLANGMIRFLLPDDGCAKSNMAYWAGSSAVTEVDLLTRFGARTPAIRARVKLNGVELTALLDTGATTLVSARAARRAGVSEADMTPSGTVYGAGRGMARAWTAPFETFQLGGETIRNNLLRVAEFDLDEADMLLGIDFFLSHRLYVSKSQSKLFFTYNGGTVFSLNKSDDAAAPAPAAEPAASGAQASAADQFARRGAASAARRDYERALADLNRACELEPASATFLAQRGVVQEALDRPARAIEDFDKALQLDPEQADARLRRASLRWRAKNSQGAKADLDALDQSLTSQAQMRLPMSHLYWELGQPAQALAQLNHWLPSHPNEVFRGAALNSRCRARLMLGIEPDKALDDCDDAVGSDRANPAYLDSRAWVHLRMGKAAKALSDFDRSLELRPGRAWTLYGRGQALKRLGEAVRGEADLQAARQAEADIDLKVAKAGLLGEMPQPAPP